VRTAGAQAGVSGVVGVTQFVWADAPGLSFVLKLFAGL
jgi:hypothetical protein